MTTVGPRSTGAGGASSHTISTPRPARRASRRSTQSRPARLALPRPSRPSRRNSARAMVPAQTRSASIAGVNTSVSTVATPRPKTTAVASCFHQSAVGLSTE